MAGERAERTAAFTAKQQAGNTNLRHDPSMSATANVPCRRVQGQRTPRRRRSKRASRRRSESDEQRRCYRFTQSCARA